MRLPLLIAALASFVVPAVLTDPASAQRFRDRPSGEHWDELGCVNVGRRADFDVIPVGRREGRYKAIMLEASGNDVRVEDLKVVYANGQPDNVRLRGEIREGERSRLIDLQGRERAIDSIQMFTSKDFRGRGRGKARLCAFGLQDDRGRGRPGPGGGGGGRWSELGCQKVGFLTDRDVIRVGRREGRFRAIRGEVTGNSIFLSSLRVVYSNGAPDDIAVNAEIRENTQTRPLDLRGRDRAIDRIEMVYRAKPNFRGFATVCVSGLD